MVAQECSLPASSSQLASARAYVSEAAAAFGLDATSAYELVYGVNEAVTNALRHGAPDAGGMIQLSVSDEGDVLTVTVRDAGTFRMPTPDGPAPGAEHGRGFALMTRFADSVQVCIGPWGTAVSLSKGRA
jgi:anti-sigma regulatory factor (Ser/Thr protein kinase)